LQNLKNTKDYYDQCLSIPLYYDLEFEQQQYVIDSIKELVSKNSF
jgi:dTDP-4-amino-4,6-dideoxygalactose transaminase